VMLLDCVVVGDVTEVVVTICDFVDVVAFDVLKLVSTRSQIWFNTGSTFTGALLYADDIALLACSCLGLQKLINIRMAFGLQWNMYCISTQYMVSKDELCFKTTYLLLACWFYGFSLFITCKQYVCQQV